MESAFSGLRFAAGEAIVGWGDQEKLPAPMSIFCASFVLLVCNMCRMRRIRSL